MDDYTDLIFLCPVDGAAMVEVSAIPGMYCLMCPVCESCSTPDDLGAMLREDEE